MTKNIFDLPLNMNTQLQKETIKLNRLKHYYGSLRHFLHAVFNNELMAQGYEVHLKPESLAGFVCLENLPHKKKFIIRADSVEITFFI